MHNHFLFCLRLKFRWSATWRHEYFGIPHRSFHDCSRCEIEAFAFTYSGNGIIAKTMVLAMSVQCVLGFKKAIILRCQISNQFLKTYLRRPHSLSSPFSDKPSRQELAKFVMLKEILSEPQSEMLPDVKSDTFYNMKDWHILQCEVCTLELDPSDTLQTSTTDCICPISFQSLRVVN